MFKIEVTKSSCHVVDAHSEFGENPKEIDSSKSERILE
jgi:hypothetical protein